MTSLRLATHNTFIEVGAYALASGLATFVVHNLDVPFLSSARTVCGTSGTGGTNRFSLKKNFWKTSGLGFCPAGHSCVPRDTKICPAGQIVLYQGGRGTVLKLGLVFGFWFG